MPVIVAAKCFLVQSQYIMPKVKTHSGAKKRFSVTGSGQIKREKAFQAHIMTSKSKKRKRNLRQSSLVAPANAKNIRIMLNI
jgi:large subunit ribosomal protein L35